MLADKIYDDPSTFRLLICFVIPTEGRNLLSSTASRKSRGTAASRKCLP